jgi:hypothetical protein
MVPPMPTAQTLSEAIDVLTPEPLDEAHNDWYVGNPTTTPGGHVVHPLGMLRASLLRSRDAERLFLSGHIGAGKSTELKRLLRDPAIRRRYFVVDFRLADEEIPEVTSTHLLFIIAAELYQRADAQDLLKRGRKRWEAILKRIDERFFGQKGVSREGSVDLKFNLLFMELRQQLKLVDSKRKEFRSFAESETTILVDLINALAEDIQLALLEQSLPERVLVVIDDIDKIRSALQIDDIFNKNLALLRAPRIPVLMTLPADITFRRPDDGSRLEHHAYPAGPGARQDEDGHDDGPARCRRSQRHRIPAPCAGPSGERRPVRCGCRPVRRGLLGRCPARILRAASQRGDPRRGPVRAPDRQLDHVQRSAGG